ncbi:hypothetical protein GCM10025868_09740 [Angustibacter aerolatus]|uniref:Uncharacterized protein n=1 Tax=Angustibacter aerolatus TaxID=1162965 RepID=A0ABQ6JD67_9ACTN|nr:hypothetical protein [Angustibacter aerolatus]GMA85724.1 hypothetical protein GCM10025868_09740 [Angustibacter aerolatus]
MPADVPAPVPPWLTTATTAYCGSFAGAYDENQDVACLPYTSPVPVLPATATGKPRNAPAAVPDVTTPRSALRRNRSTSGRTGTLRATSGCTRRTTRPSGATTALATCGVQSVPPFAIAP